MQQHRKNQMATMWLSLILGMEYYLSLNFVKDDCFNMGKGGEQNFLPPKAEFGLTAVLTKYRLTLVTP
jgi:hypothetical protein